MPQMHENYMLRCFHLARLGEGNVSPNPMVGCVIVHHNQVIGEGYHQFYGGPHAEVNAINSVKDKELLKESTVYVNLEPCSHFGKTPPCADLLIHHQVKRVVIANRDPNPLVNGEGIKKLKNVGIEVIVGVLQEEGILLNKFFYIQKVQQRPYITLKWAESTDGFIGIENQRIAISGETAKLFNHKLRFVNDAILVGTKTALVDNPQLTDRGWNGFRQPLRIVIDRKLQIPATHHLMDKSVPTLIYNTLKENSEQPNLKFIKLKESENLIYEIVDNLNTRNISSLIVEGGVVTLQHFIDLSLWDEIVVIKSKSKSLKHGINAPIFRGIEEKRQDLISDVAHYYKPISQ